MVKIKADDIALTYPTSAGRTQPTPEPTSVEGARYMARLNRARQEQFQAAIEDDKLMTLRNEVALIDLYIGESLEEIGEATAAALFKDLRQLWVKLKRARDADAFNEILEEMGEIIHSGKGIADTWAGILGAIDKKAAAIKAENNRLESMKQMIPVDQAMALMGAVVRVVTENVTDMRLRKKIREELVGVMGKAKQDVAITVIELEGDKKKGKK